MKILSKSPLYVSLAWRISLDVLSRGMFFIANVIVARSLSVGDFGKLGYAISSVQIFYIFTDLGTHLQLIKELGEERGRDEERWRHFFELKLVLLAVCLVTAVVSAPWLWQWDRPWMLVLMMFWMFGNSLLDFNQFVCNGLNRMDAARVQLFLQRSVAMAGILIPILFFRTLAGVVIGISSGSFLGSVLSQIYMYRATGMSFSFKAHFSEWRRILTVSIPNGVSCAFGAWYMRMGPVILGWLWNSRVLGEYSAAFRVLEATYIIPAGVMAISVPHLSEALRAAALPDGRGSLRRELMRVSLLMAPMGAAWAAVLYAASPLVVRILYGARFAEAAGILKVFALTGGMIFLNYFVTHLMIVFNCQRRHALHEFMMFLISLCLYASLIPARGAIGAAWSLFFTELCLFIVTTTFLLFLRKGRAVPPDMVIS